MNVDIIWLNGTSSSGKTNLAKELQDLRDDHFMHVCFDRFYQMLPERAPFTALRCKFIKAAHLGDDLGLYIQVFGGHYRTPEIKSQKLKGWKEDS
jgi:chloramphenicol 3-O-phosphotransferase